jgi:hypothetical protein
MPVASTDSSHERTRIEPGEYRATCTAVKPPEIYRAFARWYMRVDFAIHDDGAVVSKYINLGTGKTPSGQLGPRSDYYKLWTLSVGRKPEKNEPMDPAKIIGAELLVTVIDKELGGDGEAYSTVESVRHELETQEALSSFLNDSSLNSSCLNPQYLNDSITQSLNVSDTQAAQVHSGSPEEDFSEISEEEIPPKSLPEAPEDTPCQDPQARLLNLENRWVKAPHRTEAEKTLRGEYRKDFMKYRASLREQAA